MAVVPPIEKSASTPIVNNPKNVTMIRREVKRHTILSNGTIHCKQHSFGQLNNNLARSHNLTCDPVNLRMKTSITDKADLEPRDTVWMLGEEIARCMSPEQIYCDGLKCGESERHRTLKADVVRFIR